MNSTQDLVRAGGGVIWRAAGDDIEVLVVHRNRYDDWSFPKGKLEPGESWSDGARREVIEETGMTPVLGAELASTEYVDRRGRAKRVRYWAMTVPPEDRFVANDEVDSVQWLRLDEARRTLTYGRDRAVLDGLAPA